MPLFDHNSGSMTSSVKILLMSTTVLSAAIMLKLSASAITDFAVSDFPSLWNGIVAWLKPPYLYLVINGIIITIVASSRLQSSSSKSDGGDMLAPPPLLQHEAFVQVHPASEAFQTKQLPYDGVVLSTSATMTEVVATPPPPSRTEALSASDYKSIEFAAHGHVDARISETEEAFTVKAAAAAEDEMEMKIRNEFVISKATWTTPVANTTPFSNKTPPVYSSNSAEKPPPSARFGHRRKASIEGGKGALLGVSKPRKQDTLESTWKTITEGRAMPLTRHLRKSDTWETHGRRGGSHHRHQEGAGAVDSQKQRMKKSETFNERSEASSPLRISTPSKLKKEPSLSQDELNKRVEAFIKKFNEEMRLQRQESLNQYMEMINRGG